MVNGDDHVTRTIIINNRNKLVCPYPAVVINRLKENAPLYYNILYVGNIIDYEREGEFFVLTDVYLLTVQLSYMYYIYIYIYI